MLTATRTCEFWMCSQDVANFEEQFGGSAAAGRGRAGQPAALDEAMSDLDYLRSRMRARLEDDLEDDDQNGDGDDDSDDDGDGDDNSDDGGDRRGLRDGGAGTRSSEDGDSSGSEYGRFLPLLSLPWAVFGRDR